MEVKLELIDIKDKEILRDMLWDYEREMVGNKAEEYKYLDSYWEKSNRFPYFIKADDEIAGFALVNEHTLLESGAKNLSEFYIKPEYRGFGIGRKAAFLVWDLFPGKWEGRQIRENPKAHTFWLKVKGEYTNNNFNEVEMDNDKWNGWIQTFDNSSHLK